MKKIKKTHLVTPEKNASQTDVPTEEQKEGTIDKWSSSGKTGV